MEVPNVLPGSGSTPYAGHSSAYDDEILSLPERGQGKVILHIKSFNN
jgi:hypothetical protein